MVIFLCLVAFILGLGVSFSFMISISDKPEKTTFKIETKQETKKEIIFKRLSVFNKKIERIKENLKEDKSKKPDDSFFELLSIKDLIDYEYNNQMIDKSIYMNFFELFEKILNLVDSTIDLQKEISSLKENEKEIKSSFEVANSKFSKNLKSNFTNKRDQVILLIEKLTKELSECVRSKEEEYDYKVTNEVKECLESFNDNYKVYKNTKKEIEKLEKEVQSLSDEKIYPIDLTSSINLEKINVK